MKTLILIITLVMLAFGRPQLKQAYNFTKETLHKIDAELVELNRKFEAL